MTYRTAEIEITRHRVALEPVKETVYGLFDDNRLVVYAVQRFDLSAAAATLNGRVKHPEPA
jgi:hypothetical protein